MPERPELEYWTDLLRDGLVGVQIRGVDVLDPVVLRVAVPGDARALLIGRRIEGVDRRAHVLRFALSGDDGLLIAVHPMLSGRFTFATPGGKRTKDTALVLGLDGDKELRFRDDTQMGKVYVLRADQQGQIPGLGVVGTDVLGPEFTREAFRRLAKSRRDQAKVFLMDKAALDAFGNAYADEALFEAGVHPKTFMRSLDEAGLDRLHDAMVTVLSAARDEVRRRAPPLDEKVRDFLKVRNRKGQPCPRCGAPIRVAGVHGHDAFFCAVCQPDTQGRGLVDWRNAKGGG